MRIFVSTLMILLVVFTVSCEDMLVESPKDMVVENFFHTTAEAEAGIAAVYEPLHSGFPGRYMSVLSSQTDYGAGYVMSPDVDGVKNMEELLPGASISLLEPFWNSFYNSIREANTLIHYIPQGRELSQEQKDRYIAEAKFMRSFAYFNLVRLWGGVPLYTEDNFTEDTGLPRSSPEEIYNLIIDNLEFAQVHLPDNPPELGRASKWTAKTLLADVFLFNENYNAAEDLALEIIDSGNFELEAVADTSDFDNIFGPNPSSDEEIFFFRYNENRTNNLAPFLASNNDLWFGGGAWGHTYSAPENPLQENWNDDDIRKRQTWSPAQGGDNRLPAGDPYYPRDTEMPLVVTKYTPGPETNRATNPIPIYRYSYVLLLHAEVSARIAGAPTQEGMESLNKVYRRAYGYNHNQPSPIDLNHTDFNLESFIDRVVLERGYEFQFENLRWFELVRTDKLSIIEENTGRTVIEERLLWPIPSREIDLNESLDPSDQNPGYN